MTIMKNRPEEPDIWAVIENIDLEQEKQAEQQSFLLLAVVELSFLESYGRNQKPVQSAKWEHQRLDWNDHVIKLLQENRFHCEYRINTISFRNYALELR